MSNRSLGLDGRLHRYLLEHGVREHPALARLRAETARLPEAHMQIAPEQGAFMQWLVRLMGARQVLEIGTFTGYSALAMALALPPDGRLITCDRSRDWTAIARRHWEAAGVADRIELRLGPAAASLAALEREGAGPFDLAFIDADKTAYHSYYETCLRLVRPGGVILVDNVLWGGRVAEPGGDDPDTEAIRAFNARLAVDERVDLSVIPLADGLALARKR